LRKCRESDIMVNRLFSHLLFNSTHQIFIHQTVGRSADHRAHFHTFIKQLHPSLYQWTTHGMFSVHIKKLTMNFSWFHVLHIQETDYRLPFTCGGIPYFLKHYKHTARCVNGVWMSVNCIRALPQNQQTQHAYAPSWLLHCSGNICKRNLFSG
jgi:hypothetical protein